MIGSHPLRSALAGGNTIGGAIREAEPRSDGYRHLDTPTTLGRLRELNLNHYCYGIWDSPTDWDDLRAEFLPAAADAGIDVWPYIVPPSETREDGRASRPFVTDYVGWATAIAELSLEYPNLTAWSIDDFEFDVNAELFTPEYMTRMRRAQDAVNPGLGFLTCAYWRAATSESFLDTYAPFVDGIVYPFLDGPNDNTVVASSLPGCLDAILAVTKPRDLALVLLVYAGRFLDSPAQPHEDYVAEAVRIGMEYAARGDIAGVTAYGTPLDTLPAPRSDNAALYGDGRLALVSSTAPVTAGSHVAASAAVTVDPGAPRHELSFWHTRRFLARSLGEPGDLALQVLVDDSLVWSCDVFDESWLGLWIQGRSGQGPVDLSHVFRGITRATLTFRLVALRAFDGFTVDVGVDHVESIGFDVPDPGFERTDVWRITSTGGPLVGRIDVHVEDRPSRVFDAVRTAFS